MKSRLDVAEPPPRSLVPHDWPIIESVESFGDLEVLDLEMPEEEDPVSIMREAHERYGLVPVGFGYLGSADTAREFSRAQKTQLLSRTVPGHPYTFSDQRDYMNEYASSFFALTWKKRSWDALRHYEIAAAGAIPLFPDLSGAGRYDLVSFPKRMLALVASTFASAPFIPSERFRERFRNWFLANMLSESVVKGVLQTIGSSPKRVLYLDHSLSSDPDYMSLVTLVGLKRIFGANCDVISPVDYIYEDFSGDLSRAYGRGFSYSRVLPVDARSAPEWEKKVSANPAICLQSRINTYDLIVIGEVEKNAHLLSRYRTSAARIVICGDDKSPSRFELQTLRRISDAVCVRSFPF